jgi:multidrug resistance protein, MATE family
MLIYAAIYQFFDAMYIVYNGALRGAGDTLVPAIATGVLCWGMAVIGAYAVAKYAHWLGPAGPWAAATLYGITLGVFMYGRFTAGGWRRIHLGEFANPQPAF